MYRKILLAYDGSEGANRALKVGIELAKLHQAELWALAVEEKLPRFSATIDEVQEEKEFANQHYSKLLAAAREQAAPAGLELKTVLRPGHAAQTILEVAREGKFDLIVVGHVPGHHRGEGEPPRPLQRAHRALTPNPPARPRYLDKDRGKSYKIVGPWGIVQRQDSRLWICLSRFES